MVSGHWVGLPSLPQSRPDPVPTRSTLLALTGHAFRSPGLFAATENVLAQEISGADLVLLDDGACFAQFARLIAEHSPLRDKQQERCNLQGRGEGGCRSANARHHNVAATLTPPRQYAADLTELGVASAEDRQTVLRAVAEQFAAHGGHVKPGAIVSLVRWRLVETRC